MNHIKYLECLDLIIDAYDNTSIKDSELFVVLKEIYRKQNKKIAKYYLTTYINSYIIPPLLTF